MEYIDQLGRRIQIPRVPRRIISIVPSQTEFLWDLGLHEELVGISKFCIHPGDMFRQKERVGGTKQLNLERIRTLNPDLIIGNKEENVKEQIDLLAKDFPVWMSDVNTIEDALKMMLDLGRITGKENEALKIVAEIKMGLRETKSVFKGKRVVYLIWKDPYMAVGNNTFINVVLNHLGFENALAREERYPEIDINSLQNLDLDYCFLSTEPYPFNEEQRDFFNKTFSNFATEIVDGELFSWYGSRMLKLPSYVKQLKLLLHD